MSRDDFNKARSEGKTFSKNGHRFVVTAAYFTDAGDSDKFLVDYVKITKKQARTRTTDLVSFCRKFTVAP